MIDVTKVFLFLFPYNSMAWAHKLHLTTLKCYFLAFFFVQVQFLLHKKDESS